MRRYKYIMLAVATVAVLASCGSRRAATPTANPYERKPIKEVAQADLDAEARLIDALSLQESGRLDEALSAYTKLAADVPQCAAAWYEAGRLAIMRGWTDSAVACLRRAVALDGNNKWYLLAEAEALARSGDAAGSVAVWRRIVDLNPTVLEYHYELSNACINAGDITGAVAALDRVEKMIGVTEPISLQKQRLWNAAGRSDRGLKEIETLAAAMPQEKRYQAILAESYMSQHQYKKAKRCYDHIAETDPDDQYIHLQLAEYYKQTGKPAEADKEMLKAFAHPALDCRTKLQLLGSFYNDEEFYTTRSATTFRLLDMAMEGCGDLPEYALFYGDALMRQGKYSEAAVQLETALRADSSRYEVWEGLLVCLTADSSREADMEAYAARAARLFPMKTLPNYLLALCAARREDYNTALTYTEKAVKWGFNKGYLEAETYGLLAEAYYRTGNYDKAWRAFDHVLALKPDDWGTLNNYAYYLSERGLQLDKALVMSKRTIDAEPDNANSLDTYGWLLHLLGHDAEALPYLRKAVELNPKSETLQKHLEEVLKGQK